MTHSEWVLAVDEMLRKSGVTERARKWLCREAYYDGYPIEQAVAERSPAAQLAAVSLR